jgi:hypothetical protein
MNMHSLRPNEAAWWIAQLGHYLNRFLLRPDDSTRAALLNLMQQYREAVELEHVTPPRIFGVNVERL